MNNYLKATYFIDTDHGGLRAFVAEKTTGHNSDIDRAVALYQAVRDGWRYDPYRIDLRKEILQASHLLGRNHGYCVEKAVLLAAVGRIAGIPTRLGFAHVTNHLGTSKLEELLQTTRLVFHGYTEFWLEGQWVKATPAFNASLCERLGVAPLEFNGREDSIFQEQSGTGDRFMEYLHDYGVFEDLPYDLYVSELERHYPHIFEHKSFEQDGFYFRRGE